MGWALPLDPTLRVIHMGDINELGNIVAGASTAYLASFSFVTSSGTVHTLSKLGGEIDEILRIASRGQHAVPGFESLFSEGSTKAAGSSRN
jgi:hypothetical protein